MLLSRFDNEEPRDAADVALCTAFRMHQQTPQVSSNFTLYKPRMSVIHKYIFTLTFLNDALVKRTPGERVHLFG